MSRIVGVTIDTKSPHTKEKVYYYKTNKKFELGETINIKAESGGTPTATVVDISNKKKYHGMIKELEEV